VVVCSVITASAVLVCFGVGLSTIFLTVVLLTVVAGCCLCLTGLTMITVAAMSKTAPRTYALVRDHLMVFALASSAMTPSISATAAFFSPAQSVGRTFVSQLNIFFKLLHLSIYQLLSTTPIKTFSDWDLPGKYHNTDPPALTNTPKQAHARQNPIAGPLLPPALPGR
jgi:hypothetical protein